MSNTKTSENILFTLQSVSSAIFFYLSSLFHFRIETSASFDQVQRLQVPSYGNLSDVNATEDKEKDASYTR